VLRKHNLPCVLLKELQVVCRYIRLEGVAANMPALSAGIKVEDINL
jgi:hypothetical protein